MRRVELARRAIAAWRGARGTLVFVGLMLVFRSSFADWVHVPTGSMNPTVIEGDRVLVDKRAYGYRIPFTLRRIVAVGDPQRGDVVVLESPVDGITLFKRVVAIPGDTVEMRDGRLVVNGVAARWTPLPATRGDALVGAAKESHPSFFEESLQGVSHDVMFIARPLAPRDFAPMRIPDDRYLAMGDNRALSRDSRSFGLVGRDAIYGKALRVVVSLDPDHAMRPRAGRWLAPAL